MGTVPDALRTHGATVSPKSGHGFVSSNPVIMFDSKTLATIKTIEVKGNPDGYLYDAFNDRVYILSHSKPHATVIDAADGSVVGTIDDLGGAPEQAATDGKGTIYVDIEDAHSIAVVDAKTMTVKTHYDLAGKGDGCAGLALDAKNQILFAACRNPQNMVILSATDGKILDYPAARRRQRWRGVQSQNHGSFQLARQWHADGDQGEQPHQFRGRADREDHDGRQDADARQQDGPHSADRRRVRAAARTGRTARGAPPAGRGTRRPRRAWRTRTHAAGFVLDCGGWKVGELDQVDPIWPGSYI